MGVIKTLLNRCEGIVTEEEDKEEERDKITTELTSCGYPRWTMRKVKENIEYRSKKKRKHQELEGERSTEKRDGCISLREWALRKGGTHLQEEKHCFGSETTHYSEEPSRAPKRHNRPRRRSVYN